MKVTRRLAGGVLAAGMLLSVALPTMPVQVQAAPAAGMQLYVAPNGSDSAAGTIDAPLQTLEGARDKIRAIKAESGLPEGGITVNLREGDYKYMEESFTLEAQDSGAEGSPIVYQAYPGETVTLSGNVEADGTDFEPVTDESILARLPEEVRDKVLVYDVTENLGISEFAPLPKNGFGWPDQPAALNITVDGEAQTLARYPNEGFVKIDKSYSKGFVPRDHMPNPDGSCPACTKENGGERIPCKIGEDNWINQPSGVWGSRALADKYDLWSQENDIWTFGYFCWDWADDNIAVKSLEKDGDMLKITGLQPSRYGVNGGMKFYAYNLLCEIDQPGEWYLDRESGKLYLYPEKDLSGSTVELSMMGNSFIKAENAEYIQFKNLDISKGNSHGIELVDCSNTLVAGCDFSDLGQRAVVIGKIVSADSFSVVSEGAQGGHDNIVQSCNIQRTGQGGVYVAGGNRYSLTPANSKVINCSFDDYSVTKRTYSPAIALMGTGLEASNNKITNAPHMAISFDGNDNVIKNNEIAHVCYETSDSGAIYSVRRWSYRGNVITNNYIHDMVSNSGIGSAAVYLDDLMCGTEVSNNLFVNVTGYTTLIGGGRDNIVKNNIQINQNNGKGLHYDARGLGWAHYHAASPDGTCFAEWAALKNTLEQNPENWAKWQEKYPELTEMSLELDSASECIEGKKPAGAEITGNLLVGVANPFGNIDGNVKSMGTVENNESYPADTDIGFVDPNALNFEVKEGSIIDQKLGDDHFDASQVGLYKDEYRTELGVEVSAPVLTAPADGAADVSIVDGVALSWQAVEGAGSYEVELASDNAFKEILRTESVTEPGLTLTGLEAGTTYYWRVTAHEGRLNGSSAESEVRSFTTSSSTEASFYESFGNDFSAWTAAEGGTKGTPSNTTEQAHAGRYSYVQDEAMDAIEKTFGLPQQQVVTVWLYDTMESGKYTRAIANVSPRSGEWMALGVSARDSAEYYSMRVGSNFAVTEAPRSEGWHELKWDYTSGTDCKMYIDGILVNTVEDVEGFTFIGLGDYWGESNLPGDVSHMMFDDVRIGTPVIDPVPTAVELDKTSIILEVGAQQPLTAVAEVTPDVDVEFEWTQGEHEIARVDENGVVTGMRPGKTTVTVNVKGFPQVKATCEVEVVEQGGIHVDSITLDRESAQLSRTSTLQLNATILPENAGNKQVIWSSSDPNVAAVDANGMVYALQEGEAVITATAADNGKTAACTVQVTSDGYIILNPGFETGDLTGWSRYPKGETEGCTIEVTGDDAHSGSYAARVTTEDNIQQQPDGTGYAHKGIQFRLENADGSTLAADVSYTLRAWVKVTDDKTHEMGIHTMLRGGNPAGGVNATYKTVSAADGWVQVETTITPEDLAEHPGTLQLDFVIGNRNTTESAGSYLVDDAELIVERTEYTLTVNGGAGSGSYPAGVQVAATAQIPEGKEFVNWTAEGVEIEDNTAPVLVFTMPQGDVTLTAVYKDTEPEPTPKPTAEPTAQPTAEPTAEPTAKPTAEPTAQPTAVPTASPVPTPSPDASATPVPTEAPAQPDGGSSLPATGDSMPLAILAGVLVLAAAGFGRMIFCAKKH